DPVSRAPDGLLRCDLAILQGKELRGWLQRRSCCEHGIEEVQHLRAQDRVVAANEDQHLTGSDNFLRIAMTLLSRRCEAQDFVWRHQRALDMIDARVDVSHDWREARSRKVVARLLHGLRTSHLAEQFRGFDLVWRERDPDVAVRDDALVVTVSVYDLADVL